MLQNTFLHLPGIGCKKERDLWNAGILTWDDYEKAIFPQAGLFDTQNRDSLKSVLDASREALAKGDFDFFAKRLPRNEHYRIALTVPDKTGFLDIETTGLSRYYDHITLIGVGLNGQYICYIQHGNDEEIRLLMKRCIKIVD